jgi:integrase
MDRTSALALCEAGTPLDAANVRRAMQSLVKKAKLPLHFTPHCLRHTYASILLAEGVSPVYVQEQLGHAHHRADRIDLWTMVEKACSRGTGPAGYEGEF